MCWEYSVWVSNFCNKNRQKLLPQSLYIRLCSEFFFWVFIIIPFPTVRCLDSGHFCPLAFLMHFCMHYANKKSITGPSYLFLFVFHQACIGINQCCRNVTLLNKSASNGTQSKDYIFSKEWKKSFFGIPIFWLHVIKFINSDIGKWNILKSALFTPNERIKSLQSPFTFCKILPISLFPVSLAGHY